MKFEFKLQSGKSIIKEPPRRLNPFDLLKTRPASKEVVSGFPVFTDAFGRTLYENSNGQFRAIGEEFDLVANVSQLQNNLITLAPPPEDDEEDVMPKQKPKRKAGGIIIVPPSVAKWFEICFVVDTNEGERVYKLGLGGKLADTVFEEIFNCPPDFEPYEWWTNYLAFGYLNKQIFVEGFDSSWRETFYLIGENKTIVNAKVIEDMSLFYDSKFTYYEDKIYLAYIDYSEEIGKIKIKQVKNGIEIVHVDDLEFSGIGDSSNLYIWKNFIIYLENLSVKIYDFINKAFITQIAIKKASSSPRLFFSQDNNTHACFGLSYYLSQGAGEQHFIMLKENGTYSDIVIEGSSGWFDATEYQAYVAYQPYKNPYFAGIEDSEKWKDEFIVIDSSSLHRLWSKVPLQEGETFNDNFYFALSQNITTYPIQQIERIGEDKYLARIGKYLYHFDSNLGEITPVCDISGIEGVLFVSPFLDELCLMVQHVYIPGGWHYYHIHRSIDGGATWSLVKIIQNAIENIYESPLIVFCGNDVIYFCTETAMNTHRSIDGGATWSNFTLEEAREVGLPVYKAYQPWLPYYEWNVPIIKGIWENFGSCPERGIVYIQHGGYTDIIDGEEITVPPGTSFLEGSAPQFPRENVRRTLATEDGNLMLICVTGGEQDNLIYRSINGGAWVSTGIVAVPVGLYEIPEGLSLVTQSGCYLSTNGGVNWKYIPSKAFNHTFIDKYSIDGNLIKRKVWQDHNLGYLQRNIGQKVSGKYYNTCFYFDGSLYDANGDEIQEHDDFGLTYSALWLGDYVLYTGVQEQEGGSTYHALFLTDMKTGETMTLLEGAIIKYGQAYFFPEHMRNYYLKLST